MYYTILYYAITYYLDPAAPTLPISATLRLQDSQVLWIRGFRDSQILWILGFSDPLLKRKNLIGRDDRFLHCAKSHFKLIMLPSYGIMILCLLTYFTSYGIMILTYLLRMGSHMLPDALWCSREVPGAA